MTRKQRVFLKRTFVSVPLILVSLPFLILAGVLIFLGDVADWALDRATDQMAKVGNWVIR